MRAGVIILPPTMFQDPMGDRGNQSTEPMPLESRADLTNHTMPPSLQGDQKFNLFNMFY